MRIPFPLAVLVVSASSVLANPNVYVSRFWHNHQPIYWPEWNANGSQNSRVQYAWDSIVLKPGQNYGGLSPAQHPENNLTDIFGLDDRRNAYQSGPRNSLASFDSRGGFAISYSGSLIDNVRQLGSGNNLGYGPGWANGNREARGWTTPSGSTRMDLVGFTYHHSLAPLLPKSVFRKELQIFKQAWWKAWNGNPNLSDHSKGFFPTEMAYSRHLIDVLVDEGYQWVIVPSHHISRTSPSYNDRANPAGTYNIYSSPPNKADQIGPRFDNVSQWWYSEPNPGNAAWNVSPYAYQLHRVKYVNPDTGAEKTMVAVPSDDVLSYRYGYANEGIGKIGSFISPHATDPARPVIVMPSTDGDNAWGGGSSSWSEATPQFFNGSAAAGYRPATPQDFVNAHGAAAPVAHIEDGAWIFPESCYGSPNFLKWIEPPVANSAIGATNRVPGTQVDMETPGFALKFFSYAPLMAGANWVETAEQILRDEGGTVEAWKIQDPYNNLGNGLWTSPNDVELAWHIYLTGLDSGFNYYGGLGNDDEVKPALATKRAIDRLSTWMTPQRRDNDRTPPTVLKPQRFPYNPGAWTFGWFNRIPGGDTSYLKRMNSEFYVWTHAYDLSGIPDGNVVLKIRIDADGTNPIASNQNETYAGGGEVGSWVSIPMTKRVLPKTRTALNAAASNAQIDYFVFDPAFWSNPALADYYFAKITETNLAGFRNKLLDYYIEATDTKGNISRSEIQHVWVDDFSGAGSGGGGGGGGGDSVVSTSPAPPVAGEPVTVTYNPAGRNLAAATNVNIHHGYNAANWTAVPGVPMTKTGTNWTYTYTVPAGATTLAMVFNNNANTWDNNGGGNWNIAVTNQPVTNPPAAPTGLAAVAESSSQILVSWTPAATASSYKVFRNNGGSPVATVQQTSFVDTGLQPETTYSYRVVAANTAGDSPQSDPVSATTWFAPVAGDGIRVTAPAGSSSLPAGSTNFLFLGQAGAWLTNGLTWTNPLTGGSGTVPFSGVTNTNGWAWSVPVPLGPGSNAVTFSGAYSTGGTQVTGSDSPTNYTSWNNGSTGGTGFGAWGFSNTTNAGFFLAEGATNMNVNAAKGFGLYANTGGLSVARRTLPSSMNVGDSVALRIDNNWIDNGGRVGFGLANAGASNRFNFYFVGGQTTYRIDDSSTNRDSGTSYTDGGMLVTFTLTGSNSYSLSTGGSTITGTLGGSGAISQIVFSNSNAGPATERNFYVGAMTYTASVPSGATNSVAAPVVTVEPGGVTDGLPDSWWDEHNIPPGERVASADPDGDGFSNAEEFALGTEPGHPGSRFAIHQAASTGNLFTISWSSVAGKTYRLQARPSLGAGAWQDVGAPVTATNSTSSTTHAATGQHFYRVRLVP
jgi:hypothetical protein